jgi:hypothetical protein
MLFWEIKLRTESSLKGSINLYSLFLYNYKIIIENINKFITVF